MHFEINPCGNFFFFCVCFILSDSMLTRCEPQEKLDLIESIKNSRFDSVKPYEKVMIIELSFITSYKCN